MLEELWTQMERDAPTGSTGWMERRIDPNSEPDLFAVVQLRGSGRTRRSLELRVAATLLADLPPDQGTRLVDVTVEPRGPGRAAIVLALEDRSALELFAALCTDLAIATSRTTSEEQALVAWTGRFAKWRRMLQGTEQGLSPRRQRGLYAELLVVRDLLAPCVGFDEATLAWLGPDGAPRDFEIDGTGLEVKSSTANEPQLVLIHGERQLDDHGLDSLFLVHFSLESVRDGPASLPALVASLRQLADGRAQAGTLEDRLLASGYADVHESFYRRIGYEDRRTSHFSVEGAFPRITEASLPDGVGAVRYSLAIDACRDYEISRETVITALGGLR